MPLCGKKCDKYEQLVDAASDGNLDRVIELIDKGAKVQVTQPYLQNRNTPLHWAAKKGHAAICSALVAAGAEVDANDIDGWTPLFWAAYNGHTVICACLIEAGAKVDVLDQSRITPLHWAAEKGHTVICTVLVEAGAEVDAQDDDGRTPLHYAALSGHAEACAALVAAGAEVDAKDYYDRRTPLHWAATEKGHAAACTVLVEAGAEVNAKDCDGTTALYSAAKANCAQTVRVLLGTGADVANAAEVFCAGDRLPAVLCFAGAARGIIASSHGSSSQTLLSDRFQTTTVIGCVVGLERACSTNRTVLACMREFVFAGGVE